MIKKVLRCCETASLVVAIVCLAVSSFTSTAYASTESSEQRLSLAYDVFYGGIKASFLEVDIAHGDLAYRLRSRATAQGPFGWLTGFISLAESEGAVDLTGITLHRHHARSRWFGESRSVLLRPNGDGAVQAEVDPGPEDDDRDPVDRNATLGTLDPLTASFKAAREIGRTNDCAQKLPIFDGRRRYDLVFRDGVRTSIETKTYAGPALRCRMEVVRIAGFSRKPFFPPPEEPPEAFVWLAQVRKGAPPIPVRMTIDSPLASTTVHLTQVTDGNRLSSPETIEKTEDRIDAGAVREDVVGPRQGDK